MFPFDFAIVKIDHFAKRKKVFNAFTFVERSNKKGLTLGNM